MNNACWFSKYSLFVRISSCLKADTAVALLSVSLLSIGYCLDIIWVLFGYCLILFGCCLDIIWILVGYCLDVVWILFGYCLGIVCLSFGYYLDIVWILFGYSRQNYLPFVSWQTILWVASFRLLFSIMYLTIDMLLLPWAELGERE